MSERTRPGYFVAGAVNLFCLGVALAGFSSLVSACDRYRWRTIGIVVGAYVISLILKILGQAIDEVAWLQYVSLFTAYEPQKFISMAVHRPELVWSWGLVDSADASRPLFEFGALTFNAILFGFGVLSYVAAGVVFHKRDLPAPL
jgi:ABC-2 type transport system permease protein